MSWFADLERTKTHERLLPAIPISTREGARVELRDPGVEPGDPRLYELAVDIITGQVAVTRGARWGVGAVVIEDAEYRDELALLRQGRIPAMLE